MKPVRFYHFTAHGKVISIAAQSRDEAATKIKHHLSRKGQGNKYHAHEGTPTMQAHPDADKVIREDVEEIEELSQQKLNKYIDKSSNDRTKQFTNPRKYYNRLDGVSRAVKKSLEKRDDVVKEDMEDLDEVLNLQQRQKRGQVARRNKNKLERARELARHKMAGTENIKHRAYSQARDLVRRRVAGKRGAEYEKLGPSEKMIIDQQVDKKKKLIKKLALRLIPKVRRAESQRLSTFMKGKQLANQGAPEGHNQPTVKESINSVFAKQYMGKNPKANIDTEDNTEGKKRSTGKEVPGNKNIVMFSKFSEEAINETATYKSLVKKADKYDVDLEVLGEVFDRGYNAWNNSMSKTAEQTAFDRVNSFINQGKSYFNEDADLQELSKETLGSYINKSHTAANATVKRMGHLEKFAKSVGHSPRRAMEGGKNGRTYKDMEREVKNRDKGIDRATSRLTKEDADLQEVSDTALSKYVHRAVTDFSMSSNGARNANPDEQPFFKKRTEKRRAGISQAINKIDAAHGGDTEKPVKVPAKLKESASRANSPAFRAAQKNAAELKAQRAGKPAPTQNLAKKTAQSWRAFSGELEKAHKESVKHHQAQYLKHKAAYKETSDTYHDMERNHKNYGYTSKEQSHGGLEELQSMMDHHAEKMTHHYDRASYHNNMLGKPLKLKEEVELDEARPVGNKDYDESEKAWDELKKDWEKNFDKDGKLKKKKLKEGSHDELMAYLAKVQAVQNKYGDKLYHSPHGSGRITGHDPKKPGHVMISVNTSTGVRSENSDSHVEHSVHPKHLKVYKDGKLVKLKEELEEGTMKPYVKPHTNEKGEHIGWKSANKYGKIKYWQMFAKDSAHKHAGIDLKEELEKVGTYLAKGGEKLTLHRNSADPKHHMLVNAKGQSIKGFYKPTNDVHHQLAADGFKGAMHESAQSLARMKVQTVERDNDKDKDPAAHPTDVKSSHNKHQTIAKRIIETAFSSDKKPVVVPAHKDEHGNTIPAKTIMRRARKAIVNRNDNPNDGN